MPCNIEAEVAESFYFALELGPLVASWAIGAVLVVVLVVVPCCACCFCWELSIDEHCRDCHCGNCGRLKCSEKCTCSKCIYDKKCHPMPGCEKCAPRPNPAGSTTSPDHTEGGNNSIPPVGDSDLSPLEEIATQSSQEETVTYPPRGDSNSTPPGGESNSTPSEGGNSTTDPATPSKHLQRILKAGNILARFFYGGNMGPLREQKKLWGTDCRGREVMYIKDIPILDEALSLHLALTLKSILLSIFCLSTFLDLFLVASEFSCDTSKKCFPLDGEFDDLPIRNCSDVLKNPNIVIVCYEVVFDYRKAAGYAGGLYTVSRLSVTMMANAWIWIYGKAQSEKSMKCVIFIQYSLGFALIGISCIVVGLYLYCFSDEPLPPFLQVSIWIDTLFVATMISMSIFTPWHLAVNPKLVVFFKCARETSGSCSFQCLNHGGSTDEERAPFNVKQSTYKSVNNS